MKILIVIVLAFIMFGCSGGKGTKLEPLSNYIGDVVYYKKINNGFVVVNKITIERIYKDSSYFHVIRCSQFDFDRVESGDTIKQ
jgi:hypothetical protein